MKFSECLHDPTPRLGARVVGFDIYGGLGIRIWWLGRSEARDFDFARLEFKVHRVEGFGVHHGLAVSG